MRLPILILYPHSRCNCRCVMCDIWKTTEAQEITPADIDRHAADIETLQVRWVVFSGGEPLMHSDLFRLCARLRSLRIKLTILSTGLLLERHAGAIVKHVDEVIVSLDGPAEVHDRIRRVPSAFDRMKAGVGALHKLNPQFPVAARCTVQKENHTSLLATVAAARDMGLRSISFLAADLTSSAFNRPDGWTPDRQSEVSLNPDEIAALERELDSLPGDGFVLESPKKLHRIAHHFRAQLGLAEPVAPRCNAPWVSAVVESDGTVRPCFFHAPIGSLGQESLTQILTGQRAVEFRRTLNIAENPICRRCVCSLHIPDPREYAIQLLRDSRAEFLAAVEGLTKAQWSYKAAPDRWSVAELAEHILLSETLLFAKVRQAIGRKPNPEWEAQTAGKNTLLELALLNRSGKAQAPEAIVPKGNLTPAQVLSRYTEERAKTLQFMEDTELPLNEYTVEHPFPVFKTLNAYQWALYIPLHNMRHNRQIADVKSSPGFPK